MLQRLVRRPASLGLAAALLCLLAFPSGAGAAGIRVPVDTLPPPTFDVQTILDVHADRILFLDSTGLDTYPAASALRIKDRSTGQITNVPEISGQLPGLGFLTSHGAIFGTGRESYPYSEIWEWRDGVLIDHGPGHSLVVEANYAAWSSVLATTIYRRDLSTGETITISTDTRGDPDVAANGYVVYTSWDTNPNYQARVLAVMLYRNGATEQLTPDSSPTWNIDPLTDGANVVYTKRNKGIFEGPSSMGLYTGSGNVDLDSLRNKWPSPGVDYAIADGWVAYTRDDGQGGFQVWLRGPSGSEAQISPTGLSSKFVVVNPLGEVAFRAANSRSLHLGSPAYAPIEFGVDPFVAYSTPRVFWQDGNWFEAIGGILYRLDVTGRPTITSGPSGDTTDPTAPFDFISSESTPMFECKLDAGSFGACTSPQIHSNLPDGTHTFEVRLTGLGADPTPARRVWKVDTTPPSPFGLQQPAVNGVVTGRPVFSWESTSDAGTGLHRYEVLVDGSDVQELDPTACASGTCSTGIPEVLPDGAHTWQVRAVDAVGHARDSGTRSFTVADPPTATLSVAPTLALTGEQVSFDASGSSDPNGTIARYQWDLDGDGTFELDTGTNPGTSRSYASRLDGTVKIRVTDSGGLTAEAGQHLIVTKVSAQGQFGISINGGAEVTNSRNVQLDVRWPSRAVNALISNDGGFNAAGTFPVDSPIPWTLASSGPQQLPKTVYVRFTGGESGRETYTDDIILDETQPTIQSATARPLGGGSASAAKRKARRYRVSIHARDGVTGITAVQVSNKRAKPGKLRKVRRARRFAGKVTFRSKGQRIYVRAQDAAGNFSRWRKARITR